MSPDRTDPHRATCFSESNHHPSNLCPEDEELAQEGICLDWCTEDEHTAEMKTTAFMKAYNEYSDSELECEDEQDKEPRDRSNRDEKRIQNLVCESAMQGFVSGLHASGAFTAEGFRFLKPDSAVAKHRHPRKGITV